MQQFERFTTTDSIVMLVDHQTMTIDWVKSLPKATTIASCRVLARMAVEYAMPLVLTTTMEDYVGPTIPDISELAPDAFERRYKRGGELSCWDADDLRNGVQALARPNIILAGLTTDICLFWAAVDAQKLGYKVMVVADACGTMSALGDTLTYDRLRRTRDHGHGRQSGRHRTRQQLRHARRPKGTKHHGRRNHFQTLNWPLYEGELRPMAFRYSRAELTGNAIISLVMACHVVFMIVVNAGFGSGYLRAVIVSWLLGAIISFPTALVVVPPVIRWQTRHRTSATEIRPRR